MWNLKWELSFTMNRLDMSRWSKRRTFSVIGWRTNRFGWVPGPGTDSEKRPRYLRGRATRSGKWREKTNRSRRDRGQVRSRINNTNSSNNFWMLHFQFHWYRPAKSYPSSLQQGLEKGRRTAKITCNSAEAGDTAQTISLTDCWSSVSPECKFDAHNTFSFTTFYFFCSFLLIPSFTCSNATCWFVKLILPVYSFTLTFHRRHLVFHLFS